MLNPGGHLYVDTRCWEHFRVSYPRYWTIQTRDAKKGHHSIIMRAEIPRSWAAPHVIEIIHLHENPKATSVEWYPVTFYPFRHGQLLDRLEDAGFSGMESGYSKGCAGYSVLAQVA